MEDEIILIIINKRQHYFKENQIQQFLKLFQKDYLPKTIIIYEKRIDLLRNLMPVFLDSIPIMLGKTEGIFYPLTSVICIFVFSENDDGDNKQSHQLYSLHTLCHELRHRYQSIHKTNNHEELDADKFATEFMDNNSSKIRKIMKWKDEWEIEEY